MAKRKPRIPIKSDREIEAMREAGRIASTILQTVAAAAAPAPEATDDIEGVRPPVSSEEDAPIAGEAPTDDTSPTT